MTGWDPRDEVREKIVAESKKKYPHLYQELPQMFWVSKAGEFLDVGVRNGPMKQLFGPFWLEEEVAVLYAPPGHGKSALAVQLAECLARGVVPEPFGEKVTKLQSTGVPESERVPELQSTGVPDNSGTQVLRNSGTTRPRRVLYLDFEFTRAQFAHRYTTLVDGEFTNKYEFSPNFGHAHYYWNGELVKGYEDFTDMLFAVIDVMVDAGDVTALIVDNISFLTQSSTANSVVAFRLMNRLQELKKLKNISVLVLAHTPKHAEHVPLSANDLQGSIDLAKVADSMFVMGRSGRDPALRYLKHVKSRSAELVHGDENVVMYRMAKFDLGKRLGCDPNAVRADNFLGLDFVGYDDERHHLSERPPLMPRKAVLRTRGPRKNMIMVDYARKLAGNGMSAGEIAKRLGISRASAHRYARSRNDRKEVASDCLR